MASGAGEKARAALRQSVPLAEAQLERYLARTFGIDRRTTDFSQAHVRRLARLLRSEEGGARQRPPSDGDDVDFALQQFWRLESQQLQRHKRSTTTTKRQARLLCFLGDIVQRQRSTNDDGDEGGDDDDGVRGLIRAVIGGSRAWQYLKVAVAYALVTACVMRALTLWGRGKMELFMHDLRVYFLERQVLDLPGVGARAVDALLLLLTTIFLILLLLVCCYFVRTDNEDDDDLALGENGEANGSGKSVEPKWEEFLAVEVRPKFSRICLFSWARSLASVEEVD